MYSGNDSSKLSIEGSIIGKKVKEVQVSSTEENKYLNTFGILFFILLLLSSTVLQIKDYLEKYSNNKISKLLLYFLYLIAFSLFIWLTYILINKQIINTLALPL